MTLDAEHSPEPTTASNAVRSWIRLGQACQRAARGSDDASRLAPLLALVLETCGAERAFIVRSDPQTDGGRVLSRVASCSRREDGASEPSRTVVRRAMAGSDGAVRLDLAGDRLVALGVSVRSLSLRSILSAPIAIDPPARAALILDSRHDSPLPPAQLREMLEAYSALVALAFRGGGGPLAPAAAESVALAPPSSTGQAPEHFLIGRSAAYRRMAAWVRRVAKSDLSVLVLGETGAGKERVSRALHALSPRSRGPFVAVNCTALTPTLLEAELFGALRGAYTGSDRDRPGLFALAHGGTLLLDEVGDMPPAMQVKLLRVVEEGRVRPVGAVEERAVDVRLVAATHRDLASEVDRGAFRADLYHRLAVVQVRVPPLRERPEDLELLVAQLAPRLARETGLGSPRLSAGAWQALRECVWPGNIRQLHATLARALLRANGSEIEPRHLGSLPRALAAGPASGDPAGLERTMIETALAESRGQLARAASRIGWSRQKLYRRMKAVGLPRGDDPRP